MTKQEAFDKVCRHLRKQRKRAMNGFSCVFRAPDGSRCALGALLTDEAISKDGFSISDGFYDSELSPLGFNFVHALREAHDYATDNKFKARLKSVASRFGLEWRHG